MLKKKDNEIIDRKKPKRIKKYLKRERKKHRKKQEEIENMK